MCYLSHTQLPFQLLLRHHRYKNLFFSQENWRKYPATKKEKRNLRIFWTDLWKYKYFIARDNLKQENYLRPAHHLHVAVPMPATFHQIGPPFSSLFVKIYAYHNLFCEKKAAIIVTLNKYSLSLQVATIMQLC